MIRLAFSRRRRSHEDALDNIDALEVELGLKRARERYQRLRTPEDAARLWAVSVAAAARNYEAGVRAQ